MMKKCRAGQGKGRGRGGKTQTQSTKRDTSAEDSFDKKKKSKDFPRISLKDLLEMVMKLMQQTVDLRNLM